MLNRVVIAGRLTSDPELRKVGEVSVCSCRIACDRDFVGKDGNRETDFINVTAWRSTAEFLSKYFTKGRMILIDGRIQARSYTDNEGNKRNAVEILAENIHFGDSKRDSADGGGSGEAAQTKRSAAGKKAAAISEEEDDDSDIPF